MTLAEEPARRNHVEWLSIKDRWEAENMLVHTSKVKIVQKKRPLRLAYIEGFTEPVKFGVHGGIKDFYKMEPEEDLPATLDYLVASVAG